MVENGLINEARDNYNGNKKTGAFQAIGHKEFHPYFEGECTLEQAVENLKMQTRRYAKRQLTWFRRVENVNWFYLDTSSNLEGIINLTENFFVIDSKLFR